MKPAREIAADLDMAEALRKWQRKRAPLTHALLDRCYVLLQTLVDEDQRTAINGLILLLHGPYSRGREADEADRQEATEMLMRYERA